MMDRYGPRKLLTFACFICVIGTFLFTGTTIFGIAALGRFFVGLGSAFAFVGVLKLATIWLPENKLAMVSGLTSALGTVGAMLGDNFLELFVTRLGWIKTLNMTALFGIVLTFILWLGIHDKKGRHRQSGTISNFKKCLIDLNIIMRNKQIWINGFYGCMVYLPTTVFAELWGIPYLRHAHGLTAQAAGLANSLLFLGFTVGAPLMGYFSDRMARRKPPMFLGAALATVLILIILYCPGLTQTQIQIFMFFLGLFYSAQAIVFAVGRELSPGEAAGTAMAFTNMIVMLGGMLLQPLVGHLLDFSYSLRQGASISSALAVDNVYKLYNMTDYRIALAFIPISMFIAVVLTFFLRETHAHVPK
jgi:MFS family permease